MSLSQEYTFAGEPWLDYEDKQLSKEYTTDKLTLMQIAKIHKRMPGGIVSRLKKLNLISMRQHTRGYSEYQSSELYKEICKNNDENRKNPRNKRDMNKINNLILETLPKLPASDSESDTASVSLIRNDLIELNKKVDKILEIMNALYEFESSQ
jgi:hypothetical protein